MSHRLTHRRCASMWGARSDMCRASWGCHVPDQTLTQSTWVTDKKAALSHSMKLPATLDAVRAKPAQELVYRPDVDGLRAIAVLVVVIFHVFPEVLPGGFIGVDVFFVISGFLISGIILKELEQGRFTILNFYRKRVRRIFPALIVVLTSTITAGRWLLFSDEYESLGKHTVAGTAFTSNVALWLEAGYFDVASELKPLLHLWSLGVEEQFYFVWPAVAVLAWRSGTKLRYVTLTVMVFSFALNVARVEGHRSGTFFLPPTRFWELMVGSALAQWNAARPTAQMRVPAFAISTASIFGLLLIGGACGALKQSTAFPGWPALLPVVGAAAVIAAGQGAWANRAVLSNKFMVAIGKISYPLYLWHWPILAVLRIVEDKPTVEQRVGGVALAFLLSGLTYFLVETPVRHSTQPFTVLALCCAMLVPALAGLLVWGGQVRTSNYPQDSYIVSARQDWYYPDPTGRIAGQDVRVTGKGLPTVLYVGDSNMEQYFARVEEVLQSPGATGTGIFLTGGGCPPIPGVYSPDHDHCTFMDHFDEVMDAVRPDAVVFGGQWFGYFSAKTAASIGIGGPHLDSVAGADLAFDALAGVFQGLSQRRVKTYLVLNIPIGAELDPASMVERHILQGVTFRPTVFDRLAYESRNVDIQKRLLSVAAAAGVSTVDPLQFLCDASICPTVFDRGKPMYKDVAHLRSSFVRMHVKFLDAVILLH